MTPTDHLLSRHLHRIGADETNLRDPHGYAQTSMLRLFLNVLQSALDDEHLDPEVAQRIVERLIYGAVPQPPAAEQMEALYGRLTEQAARADIRRQFHGRE